MKAFSKTTQVVVALVLVGSLGMTVQALAGSKRKHAGIRKDKPPIELIIRQTGHVKDPNKFIEKASTKSDSFDFYYFAKEDDPTPGHFHKDSGKKAWVTHRKIKRGDMISVGPQVTQHLSFNSADDLDEVVSTMD